jgi:hypothetical protein
MRKAFKNLISIPTTNFRKTKPKKKNSSSLPWDKSLQSFRKKRQSKNSRNHK